MNVEDEFYLEVANALSGCQMVEQSLKHYISEAFELAHKCIGDKMAFSLSGDDYKDASLERLIGIFNNKWGQCTFNLSANVLLGLAENDLHPADEKRVGRQS